MSEAGCAISLKHTLVWGDRSKGDSALGSERLVCRDGTDRTLPRLE